MNVFGIVFRGENHKRMDTVTFDKNLWNQKIKGKSLKESLEWVVFQNFKNPCFSTSFGQEDQVNLDKQIVLKTKLNLINRIQK